MKNLTKLWSLALLLTASMFMISCEEDEPTIDVDEDGLSLADGYYFSVEGEDPSQDTRLQPETVEGEGNAAVERTGFFGNYVFLSAGDYNLVSVVSKEITSTLGGTLTEIPGEELTGDEVTTGYDLAIMEEDGEQINIANDGFFKISYDETTSELIVMEVETVSIIGDATENGWSDTDLNIISSSPEDGVLLEKTNMVLNNGNFKIRINNGWKIIRTDDEGNGYIPFTNYGGTVDNLVAGGGDIAFDQGRGVYTVEVTLTNDGGASLSFTQTGDGPQFNPDENQWAITGAATPNGWPQDDPEAGEIVEDFDMTYAGETNGTYTWEIASIDLSNDVFKFRANDGWDKNLGFSGVTIEGPNADLIVAASADDNFENTQNGEWKITLSTSDEGNSYTASFELLQAYDNEEPGDFNPNDYNWGLIGEATGGWNDGDDVALNYVGEDGGTHTWSVDAVEFTAAQFKLRANGAWDTSLGFSALTIEGSAADNFVDAGADDNITAVAAGTYDVTLTTSDDGGSYVITFE